MTITAIDLPMEKIAEFCDCSGLFGQSPRTDRGEDGRFRCFTREQIADRNDNLDISWLRNTSNDPEDELTEPEAIATHLGNALREIEIMMEEFTSTGETR
jgi:type I restriction enzyme M protein